MNKKKIVFLTGTRADFGKLKPLISAVDALEDFSCRVFVTGMHLLRKYGNTFKEVEKSGFKNIHKYINQHLNEPMDMILANTIHGLSRYIQESKPDMLVIHGDRVEALAGAIVGSMNNILVVHIEGGEKSGTIDELIRHSVTKLSHIHLVANEEAKNRILQMGELERSVFIIGSADIDVMKNTEALPTLDEVNKHYDIHFDKYHLVMFHPVTTEVDHMESYVNNLLDALIESKENYIVIYPNNDLGCDFIFKAYDRIKNNKNFLTFPSIRFENFLILLHNARSIIGNSSAGIREAPIFGVPSVNIGSRQDSRFRHISIFDCNYEKKSILDAIEKIATQKILRFPTCEYFGNGNSVEKFISVISSPETWSLSIQKSFEDIYY